MLRAILTTMTLIGRPQPLTVDAFEALLGFPLDPFQREAIFAYAAGHSVLVAAPTGTGKTAIAEYAALDALARGGRALYTTPIKALSNQKFRDFQKLLERAAERGLVPTDADAGLLTGDLVVNSNARLLVMTTEVLRNMLVQGRATPEEAGVIVFDEVHYMGDPERGTAWEESILLSPRFVPFVCLSATVPNAGELADWIRAAHGDLTCVFHEERTVPLEHRYFVDGKAHLIVDANGRTRASFKGVGGELARNISRPGAWGAPEPAPLFDADDDEADDGGGGDGGRARARKGEPKRQPAPWEVLRALEAEQLTPAIYFLFSRRACEEAAMACVALPPVPWGMELVREAKLRLADLPPEDRALRQVALLFRLLPRGIAVHHAGLLPVVKMLVEDLFQSGRLRAVFATDTLALGINMPARTVVVGEMSKWDGQQHRLLTPNEYRQMTGRAGRRGIDARGVSVVLYSPWVSFERSLALMTGELLPLVSAFSPSYSTALNLWRQPGDQERLADLYARSFRRYQRANRMEALADERDELKATFEQRAVRAAADPDTWEMARELAQTERALARARQEVRMESRALVSGIGQVLERFGYLADERPTYKATLLRGIFDANALVLGELIFGRYLEGLEPAELAEVCAWFAFDRDAPFRGLPLTRRVYRLREEVLGLQTKIMDEERRARVTITRPINEDLKGAALAWAEGEELGEIARRARLAEGDLVGLLQKTIDIMNQLRAALERFEMPPRRADRVDRDGLIDALVEADALLRRGVVEASYRWALAGPPDPDDEAAADWTPPTLEDEEDTRSGRPPRG
ncbi:MAG: DEAD/DEAH box helicase, partial [Chloroflexota bacterium]|nr:DEAD/DEAH box helicase [Chloroflexota bacterium]